jgi:NRPS condensation-like uncharacterized protein
MIMVENYPKEKISRKVAPTERFFAKSPFSIVTMVARIKGSLSEEMLVEAVSKVQQRHANLRQRISEDQHHDLWFTSQEVGEIPIQVVPRTSEHDWIKIHAAASKVPFEFETQPAIRFILVQSSQVSDLIILCHHIICDGMSLAYLARDLLRHLGDPSRVVEVLPAPQPIDQDNLPADVSQSTLVKLLINRMNRQWSQESVFFDQQDYRTLTKAYWDNFSHEILSIELPQDQTSALVSRCRKENITVNSALTAAFSGAQSAVEGEKPYHAKIVVAADLRDRLPQDPGEGMGMYAGGVELQFKYNHKRGFWENASQLHQKIRTKFPNKNLFSEILNWLYLEPTIFEAMNFKKLGVLVPPGEARYGKLSAFSKRPDVVSRILQRDKLDSLETKHWGTAVTNLGRLDFPTSYGALELDRLIMQPGGGIPLANVNLVLGAVTCSGKLSLVLEYSPQAVPAGTMGSIKDKALAYLFGE